MELERLEKLVDFAKRYSLSLIPLLPGEKKPAGKWKEISTEETLSLLSQNGSKYNIGIALKNKVFVIDIDEPEKYPEVLEKLIKLDTFTVRTRRGYHFYLYAIDFIPKNMKLHGIDIKAEGGYVVAPGSVVDGIEYLVVNNAEIQPISYREFSQILNIEKNQVPVEERKEISLRNPAVSRIDFQKLKEIILKYYHKGNRQNLIIYLAGWLLKLGCNKEDILSLVYDIISEALDEEPKMRLAGVFHTVEKFQRGEEIKGLSGLVEVGIPKEELLSCITESFNIQKGMWGEEYIVRDWFLYAVLFKKGEEYTMPVGPYLEILEKRISLDGHRTQTKYLVRHRSQLAVWEDTATLSEIERFTGLQVMNEKVYKSWLNTACLQAPVVFVTKKTGWHNNIFLHPARETRGYIFDENHILLKEKRALYKNTETQHEVIQNLLKEGKLLGFLVICGVTSILLERLSLKPFMTIISGPAGVGKTFAVSFTTHLFYDSKDILLTANTTPVALELTMKSMKNLPILVDEGALKGRLNLEELVFMIAAGRGRARGTINLNTIVTELSGVVFLTSEVLDTDEFKRSGAHRRCIHLSVKDWKDMTEIYSIQELRKLMKTSCGAGIDYIKYIESIGEEKIREIEEKAESMCDLFPDFANIAKACFASLYFLSLYYREGFEKMEEFMTLFFKSLYREYEEEEKDVIQKFLTKFREYIVRNMHKFYRKDVEEKSGTPREIIGMIEENDIYMLTSAFSEFCKDHGFERKVLLQLLSERKVLQSSGNNRYRKIIRIKDQVTSVYHFILPEEESGTTVSEEDIQAIEALLNTNLLLNANEGFRIKDTSESRLYLEKYKLTYRKYGEEEYIDEEVLGKISLKTDMGKLAAFTRALQKHNLFPKWVSITLLQLNIDGKEYIVDIQHPESLDHILKVLSSIRESSEPTDPPSTGESSEPESSQPAETEPVEEDEDEQEDEDELYII